LSLVLRAVALVAAVLSLAGPLAAAETVTRVKTSKGTLLIIADDAEVRVQVRFGGHAVTLTDLKTKKQYELKAGDLEVRLGDGNEAVTLTTDSFTLRRGQKKIATVRRLRPDLTLVQQKAEEVRRIEWADIHVYNTVFSPDGRYYLAGGDAGALRLYSVKTGEMVREFTGHEGWSQHAVFTPDGKRMLSAGTDKTVRLWDIASGKELRKFEGHEGAVQGVDLSPDGKYVLAGGDDKTLRVWEVESGKLVRKLEGHTGSCTGSFSRDGKRILSSSHDKTLRLWDAQTGKELRKLEGHTEVLWGAFLLPGGKRALSYSADRTARVWDLEAGKELSKLDLGENPSDIRGVALSSDGKRILAGTDGSNVVRLLDLATGKEVHRFELANNPRGLSFSRDGRFAASGSFRGLVYLWRLPGTFAVERPASEKTGS
jgi:DNA-binding beta-propeller fold protein YncE